MTKRFLCQLVDNLFVRITPALHQCLEAVDRLQFADAITLVDKARQEHAIVWSAAGDDESLLRDLFAFERFLNLLQFYIELWRTILDRKFAASWNTLQDALDQLRLVKKFSSIDASFFETPLLELESAYPYKVFASIGAIVDRFECSICALDIDGMECIHRRGELYRGKVAYGIAREVKALDHVSLVVNPDDKRCVIQLDDQPAQFQLVDYIRELISSGQLQITSFAGLKWSRRDIPNPDYSARGRNNACYCGSGRKFKNCCEQKRTISQKHVDIISQKHDIRTAIA